MSRLNNNSFDTIQILAQTEKRVPGKTCKDYSPIAQIYSITYLLILTFFK